MNIKRFNFDFGNSIFMALADGYYFEMPTNVVELTKEKAEGYFTSAVESPKEFKERILISTSITGTDRYFLVGDAAENEILGNRHINKLHDKTESEIPYVQFLAGVSYNYFRLFTEDKSLAENNHITIDYLSTMLPIWLLKKLNKFSEMQDKMASRFLGEHHVNIHTLGLERSIKIEVLKSKCRIESEVSRWTLKKNFELLDIEDASQFKDVETVLVDIGGGTVDAVILPPGLQAPLNRHSFQCFTDIPYLGELEKFRTEKVLEHFDNVRELDEFIYSNIDKTKMERTDGISGKKVDLSDTIQNFLFEYAQILNIKLEDAFPIPKDKKRKYVYIGGVAPILEQATEKVISNKYSPEIYETNHITLTNARKRNIEGLEILSIAETSDVVTQ